MAPIFDWQNPEPDEPQGVGPETLSRIEFIFNRFTRLVQVHQGSMLEDACIPDEIPQLNLPPTLAHQWELSADAYTQGCTGNTRFALPYEKEDGGPGYVTACAVCDHGPTWPRLKPAHA